MKIINIIENLLFTFEEKSYNTGIEDSLKEYSDIIKCKNCKEFSKDKICKYISYHCYSDGIDPQGVDGIVPDEDFYCKGFDNKQDVELDIKNKWFKINEKLPNIDDNCQLLIKTNLITFPNNFNYEIARYTKWGFHYGTRNTQDIIPNQIVIEWKYIE